MKIAAITFCVICVFFAEQITAVIIPFKSFATTPAQQAYLQTRSNADSGETLQVIDGAGTKAMVFYICPAPQSGSSDVDITFQSMRYSNQNGIDTVKLYLDGDLVGSFDTVTTTSWNDFANSGSVTVTGLSEGAYQIKIITETTGDGGVEFDKMELTSVRQMADIHIDCSKEFLE